MRKRKEKQERKGKEMKGKEEGERRGKKKTGEVKESKDRPSS